MTGTRAKKHFLLRIGAVLLGAGLAFFVLEQSLRLPIIDHEVAPPHADRRGGGSPTIRRNRPDGETTRRLLVLGDSFTFGFGVAAKAAYPMQLAKILRRRDPTLEVVSIARPGWNTVQESRLLDRYLDGVSPDLLIVGYCLNDAEPQMTNAMVRRHPELLEPKPPETGPVGWLYDTSVLFHRARDAFGNLRRRRALNRYYRGLYEDPAGVEKWRRALARMGKKAKARNVPLLLVIFPIFDSPLDWRYAHARLHERVATEARQLGFEVFDLLPAFRTTKGSNMALVPYTDPHPSPTAHRFAAQEIARFIEEKGLIRSDQAASR